MKNKHLKNVRRFVSVSLSTVLTAASVFPAGTAVTGLEYPEGSECVIVSDDNILFNVERAEINGNVFAHDNIDFYGTESVNTDGSVYALKNISDGITSTVDDKTVYSVPDFSDGIAHNAVYSDKYESDIELSERTLDVTEGIYVGGALDFDEVSLSGQGYITAEGSINCHLVQSQDENTEIVLYSKDGDIVISGSKLTINGIIYAPNGKVIFNVKELTLNGGVYAEDISFNGTSLSINKTEDYTELVTERLTVDAGPDREIYVAESIDLEGSANYDNVSFAWSSDPSVHFENADTAVTTASFSETGTYELVLTGRCGKLADRDTLTVKVLPDPTRVFTTTSDFANGDRNGTKGKNNALTLDTAVYTSEPVNKTYTPEGVSGIKVDSTIGKDKITAASDSFDITYDLTGTSGSDIADDAGVDFAFVIDNSGSMYGAYLENAQEAARTILGYMREGDRFAITDLGRVHTGFTDDKEKLEQEIANIRSGSGSSEPDDGIRIATALFDEESSDSRQKYIILLADGIACDGDYSMETMRQSAQQAADRNIKIFSLAMNSDIQNMQEAAIISKGVYKNCPDAPTIKAFMERFGEQIFTSAARNVIFKTTVADAAKIDFENIAPAPASVKKNKDGSADIAWNMDSLAANETASISIPVKYDSFAASGYERISYNSALYYNDKEGKGQKTYLDDIALPCEHYQSRGTWSAVYDSGRENCEWTGIFWNGNYPSDSRADVYISVSENGTDYSYEQPVTNYTAPENLRGRYIRVRAELFKGSDGSAPVIEDITVISGTMKLSAPLDCTVNVSADRNGSVYANRPFTLYADIQSTTDSVKTITWTVSGTEQYTLDDTDPLKPTVIFAEAGTYSMTLKAEDDSGRSAESTFAIEVKEEENVEDIIFDDGSDTAPVKYTVEGAYPYYNNSQFTLKLITPDPSAISWVSVRYIPDEERFINRYNEVYVFHITEELTSTLRLPYYNASGTFEIVAYDWSGHPYPYSFRAEEDTVRPSVQIIKPESTYLYGRFYNGEPYTVKVEASDDKELKSVTLLYNNEEVPLDENNSFTFVPTADVGNQFTLTAVDVAGNTATTYYTMHSYEDNTPPYFNFQLNRSYAFVGNEIVLTSQVTDNETGVRSAFYTVNDEPISLDEDGKYSFIAEQAGEYIFKGTAEDNRGNIREVTAKLTVVEDTQRPSVNIQATCRGEILVGTSALVTVTTSDNVAVAKVEVDVNGKKHRLNDENQFTLKATEAGDIIINAIAYDKAGNSGSTTYRLKAIEEDTTPPSISFYVSRYEYRDYVQSISVTCSDNTKVSKRKLYLDGKELTPNDRGYASPNYSYTDYYEFNPYTIGTGEHTVKAVAVDASGNRTVQEKTFIVSDTTQPYISFDGAYYFNTGDDVALTLKITDSSPIASVTGTLNDSPITLTTDGEQALTIPQAEAGTYLYSVTATDIFGNTRTSTRTVTVRDTLKPVITLSEVAEEYFIPEKPLIRMTVTDNIEVASVTVKMNGSDIEYDGKKLILPDTLAEGTYIITITAKDTANNTATETISFTVSMPRDTTPPVIESVQLIPEHPEVGSPIKVYVTASDDSGEVTVEVITNGVPFDKEDNFFTYTPQTTGELSVTIRATDPSGNTTAMNATGYVSADITAPVITVDYQTTMMVGETQTISLRAEDNKAVSSVSLLMNENNVALSEGKYQFSPTAAGKYDFVAYATDTSGNIGTKSFTIDVTEKLTEEDLKQFLVNSNETAVDKQMEEFLDKYDTPVKVYEYAKNELKPQYYAGSRKGASGVYDQGGGNDVDSASFLIAALRKLGYPSRYVSGTVMYDETELLALTGAENVSAAIDTLNMSDYDSQPYYTPSGKKLLAIRHTWAEAYIPASMCGKAYSSKIWVTLDPWYKTLVLEKGEVAASDTQDDAKYLTAEYLIGELENIEKEAGHLDSVTNLKNFFTQLNEKRSSGYSYKVPRISKVSLTSLPSSPEFTVRNRASSFAEIDQEDRDTISVNIDGKEIAVIDTYGITAKNIVLQYLPEGDSDKAAFDNADGNWKKAGTGISVVPVITADGIELGRGNRTNPGKEQTLTVRISSAGKVRSFNDIVSAGNMYAIVANLYDVSGSDIELSYEKMSDYAKTDKPFSPYSEELLGSLLNYAGKMYFSLNDRYEEIYSGTNNMNVTPGIAVGLFGYEFGTKTNFYGNVTGLKDGRFMTDIDEYSYSAVSRSGSEQDRREYILSQGSMSSYLEGYIWSYITDAPGLSTMSVISDSKLRGINILDINSENLSTIYSTSLSDEVKNDIIKYVGEGYSAIVPEKEITIDDWSGTGYILVNYNDLEKTYFRLSDNINGGGESLEISLDDVMVHDDQYRYGWGASGNDPSSPSPPDDKPSYPKNDLRDGVYTVVGHLLKGDLSGLSMADGAMEHELKLTVKNKSVTVTADFNGMTVNNIKGYMNKLEYYTSGYTTDENNIPSGTCLSSSVISVHKDSSGNIISDEYGTNYPKSVSFPLIYEAFVSGYAPLRITADVIESTAPGHSINPVYLRIDWNTLKYKGRLPDDPGSGSGGEGGNNEGGSGSGGSSSGGSGSGGSEGGSNSGYEDYYGMEIDLEKLMQQVYRVRVMIATLRLERATVNMNKAAYKPLIDPVIDGTDIFEDASSLVGAASDMFDSAKEAKFAANCLFDARTMLMDFYFETGDQKPMVMEMMSKAFLEADACLNEYFYDEYQEKLESIPNVTDPDYWLDKAKDKVKDSIASRIPEPVKKGYEKVNDYLELYFGIVTLNEKLHALAEDDD